MFASLAELAASPGFSLFRVLFMFFNHGFLPLLTLIKQK